MNRFSGITAFMIIIVLASTSIASSKSSFAADKAEFAALISDRLFLYSDSVQDFDVQAFLDTLPGPLKNYSEQLDGETMSAAEIVRFNAIRYGINPQVILVLLEARNGILTDFNSEVPTESAQELTGETEPSLYNFIARTAAGLLRSYDARRYHEEDNQVTFSNGESTVLPIDLNPGTYAVQVALAQVLPQHEWERWVKGTDAAFRQRYSLWFGDSLSGLADSPAAQSSLPDGYILPFTVGETWYYTSGPHNYSGGVVGCSSGAGCPRPWSSIDIAPPEVTACPGGAYPANRWIVAAKGGTVVQSSQALVVIDHGDGWRTYYSHVASTDRVQQAATVNQGQPIGHPSCETEPGGSTSGVHVHFAIWQQNIGFTEIVSFTDIVSSTLSSWLIQESTHYNGTMNRNNAIRTADTGRLVGTNDILNSVTLFSDTFADGNFDGWTVVDAAGAQSGPSDWKVVSAKRSLVLQQDSNIHTPAEPYEGTYVFTGQSTWSDYLLNVDVEPDDNDGVFALFRYADDSNHYRFIMDRERSYRRLQKKVNGIYTTLAEDLTTGYGDGWTNIRIAVLSDTISVSLDYAPVFTVTDDSFSSGMIGIGTWGSTDCYFDNIIVTTSGIDPYADAVAVANIKISGNGHADLTQALGRPNGSNDYDYVSVGGPSYWFVVDMGLGEEIIDGPGYDFRVYEVGRFYGATDEEYNVSVSNSPGGPWAYVGQGWSTSGFDLAGSGLDSARYVRIDDLSTRTGSPFPGSDIDAVQNLNMAGDVLLEAPRGITLTTINSNIVLNWSPVINADGYNVYFSQKGGGVGFDILASMPMTATSYTHSNAANDGYFYTITAIGPEGYESGFSSEVPYRTFLPLILRSR
jgi:hypothetical protein